MRQCRCSVFSIHVKVPGFREKNPALPIEKFPPLELARSTIMLQHLVFHFFVPISIKRSLTRLSNKGKFQTISSKSGRGRLREVVAYKRFQRQWSDLQTQWYFRELVTEERSGSQSGVSTGGLNRRLILFFEGYSYCSSLLWLVYFLKMRVIWDISNPSPAYKIRNNYICRSKGMGRGRTMRVNRVISNQ